MKAIRHTGIVVSNLERSLHFYRDIFGLKVVRQMEESGDYIDKVLNLDKTKVTTIKLAAEDESLIELLYYSSHHGKISAERNIYQTGISHIAFTVKNLEAEYKRLSEAGVQFNCPPQISPDGYAKVTFCKDPDGCFIELVEVL